MNVEHIPAEDVDVLPSGADWQSRHLESERRKAEIRDRIHKQANQGQKSAKDYIRRNTRMSHYSEPVKDNRSYRATQIVSDYLRKTGIDGVAYRSSLSPEGVNYTIFNSHPSNIKYVGSKILIHKQANHSF